MLNQEMKKPPFIILFKEKIKNSAHMDWQQILSTLKRFFMFIAHYKLQGGGKATSSKAGTNIRASAEVRFTIRDMECVSAGEEHETV